MNKKLLSSKRHSIDQIKIEIDKNRKCGFESRTKLIIDYENRIITEESIIDRIKYEKEIDQVCKEMPNLIKLYKENNRIFLTFKKNYELVISSHVFINLKIDQDIIKMSIKKIESSDRALELLQNNLIWENTDNLHDCKNIIPALCYVMNSHTSQIYKLFFVIKKCILFKSSINYTKPQHLGTT